MKRLFVFMFFIITFSAYGQEKFALVIGNSNYINFGTLQNPVNDAIDIKSALDNLGFNVDILLDGNLNQMENAAIRLKNRLTEAGNNSIGFFYYAGHGLELGGVNYLIPSNANIPDRNFLRDRAFSVQIMLDMLNDSRNALNIIVLDACRDFPATWSRSLNRGLVALTNPPANHIIMYATGAGTVANDGTGRNGLFTSHLLNNLKQTGVDINDIFRRTMGDVARASNNNQRPALYTDFAESIYFGSKQVANQPSSVQPVPLQSNTYQNEIIVRPSSIPQNSVFVEKITGNVQRKNGNNWEDVNAGDILSNETIIRINNQSSMVLSNDKWSVYIPENKEGRVETFRTLKK